MLDQAGNRYTDTQMKRRLRIKLTATGDYRKLLVLLEKKEDGNVDTWKKYTELCLKWYNKNLQFGLTGPTSDQKGYTKVAAHTMQQGQEAQKNSEAEMMTDQ